MGCDIHLYVEKRVDGKWIAADKWTPDEADDGRLCADYASRFYSGRNYDLFAILADVRNGHGFAGVKTGSGFNVISPPKGIPQDCCAEIRQCVGYWDTDGHSHSWLTVDELLSFDWTQKTKHAGVVCGPILEKWNRWDRHHGAGPSEYCGQTFGKNQVHLTDAELSAKVKEVAANWRNLGDNFDAVMEKQLGNHYAECEWEETYAKSVGPFLSGTLPRLYRLGKPDDVRIVFFFDN
jgi:hypothetical protein